MHSNLALRADPVQVVDEAKKRAVSQNVDYDTFKNMVAVAHLKPIHAQSTGRSGEGMHA